MEGQKREVCDGAVNVNRCGGDVVMRIQGSMDRVSMKGINAHRNIFFSIEEEKSLQLMQPCPSCTFN